MTDKVQKVKDWISKEQEGLMDAQGNFEYPEHEGAYNVLCNLEAFIDKECQQVCPVEESVNKDFEMALAEMVDKAQKCVVEPWVVAAQWKDCLIELAKSEEPVSEDVVSVAKQYVDSHVFGNEEDKFTRSVLVDMFCSGAKWQKTKLWKPADGDDLPIFDREVIVLTQPYPLENSEYAVSFAHRPNPDGWDGKSLSTGKVEHYTPKTYGKGGWNIPDVKYWLDCSMPKIEED